MPYKPTKHTMGNTALLELKMFCFVLILHGYVNTSVLRKNLFVFLSLNTIKVLFCYSPFRLSFGIKFMYITTSIRQMYHFFSPKCDCYSQGSAKCSLLSIFALKVAHLIEPNKLLKNCHLIEYSHCLLFNVCHFFFLAAFLMPFSFFFFAVTILSLICPDCILNLIGCGRWLCLTVYVISSH